MALAVCGCSRPEPPNVLLVTIDTLRADHLSTYGYQRETSPRVDALASRGVRFETAISPMPETQPACASLLTGRWPVELGVRVNARPLGAKANTMAEILGAHGYDTAGFVSGYPLIRRLSALDQGFGHFDDTLPDGRGGRPGVQRHADKTTEAVLQWLDKAPGRPFFLWVHFYDPHGDYAPGPRYDSLFEDGSSGPIVAIEDIPPYQHLDGATDASLYTRRYDGEIRRVDTQLGRILDTLDESALLENTLVVVMSDHGESLTEHEYYFDHGNELYMPSVHIPLIFAGPGIPDDGRSVAAMVRMPDILPTLLELLALPIPAEIRGRSFLSAMLGGPEAVSRESYSDARVVRYKAHTRKSDTGPKLAARDDRYSAILRLNSGAVELYDRRSDPQELIDILGLAHDDDGRAIAKALKQGLRARLNALASAREPEVVVFSPSLRKRIDALADARAKP